jgi:hypothetical protein
VTERHDDRPQFFSGGCHLVLAAPLGPRDDANFFELAQALREQRGRHPRHAAADFIEARTAAQQLAHHQRRPALAEDFGCTRNRAETGRSRACGHATPATGSRQVQILDYAGALALRMLAPQMRGMSE